MGKKDHSKKLMSGNEAFAQGALEAGVGFCASYPGTPSTEITETLKEKADKHDVYVEWSVNEKVALEVAAGASWAGIAALCPMKSLGLNVAADFLLNLNLSGSGPGGLVIVVCDDPRGHSSSNEQDSRFYAKASYLPLLEPTSCQEAKDLMQVAFDISKRHQIPVLVRSTTRLSHSTAIVELGDIKGKKHKTQAEMPERLFNVPNPHLRHRDLDNTRSEVCKEYDESTLNSQEVNDDSDTLIIASGVCYRYGLEALEILGTSSVDIVKLVTSHPIPRNTLFGWWKGKKRIIFLEEVDPFIEEQILALYAEFGLFESQGSPLQFYGKQDGSIPNYGELNTNIVIESLSSILDISIKEESDARTVALMNAEKLLISRPLTFCVGCTHRNFYWAIRKLKKRLKDNLVVAGDIGCYSLGVFYDAAMNTMQAMGSGIGTAAGLGQLERFGFDKKVIAVAGDSTFFHACIPGLINARHKNADLTFLILDNSTTAMTGFQVHPGFQSPDENQAPVSIKKIVEAIEPDLFEVVDATDIDETLNVLHRTVNTPGLKVLLVNSVCRLEKHAREQDLGPSVYVDEAKCIGEKCKICVAEFACPALEWNSDNNIAMVLEHACIRCGACIMVCPHDAIKRQE
ncbi:MAG: indolepyruvate ferredoxin oxidoreductase subunit alpha [Candidatus Thorarchaeota archaeon]|nr:indolepyruvate ferredoxin oxidoreductase subunit alpha [Candidatus Thorarchaeota archaeon]